MSIQLQVAIPLFVTVAALVGIAIWRKYLKAEVFVVGLVVLSLGAFMTFSHMTASAQQADKTKRDKGIASTMRFSLALAQRYILDGQYDPAMDVLNGLLQSDGADQQVRLTAARCALLRGDLNGAVQMYRQVSGVDQERDIAFRLLESSRPNDDAFITYLEDQGKDPADYGMVESPVTDTDFQEVKDLVLDAVEKDLTEYEKKQDASVSDVLDNASKLTQTFEEFVRTEDESVLDEMESVMEDLTEALKKKPSLKDDPYLDLAQLKGYTLTGDHEKIAKELSSDPSEETLVIIAELLVSGLIDKKDLSDRFVMDMKDDGYDEVLRYCRKALENGKDQLSDDQYQKYKGMVEDLKDRMKDAATFTLQQKLLEAATDGDPAMQSKCYMALAKLENWRGNESQAEIYISAALGTASNSDDEAYLIPMMQMTDIIQGNSETAEVMNVAEYVDAALDHSLPLQIQVSHISSEEAPETGGLKDQMTDSVLKSTATINIGVIDKGEFPQVQARIQIQSQKWTTLEELREHLNVYDCGSQITDFQLEPLVFQSSKIILLCDCSGSMDGSEESLRQVVRDFAATMEEGEEVCVVGFSSGIEFVEQFSGDKDVVAGYADRIYANGGTRLFSSLLYCGDLHTQDINANNIIIAMTDGQDGDYAGEGEMSEKIGAMVAQKGVTVYTVGLGDVDADYLQKMAMFGNGSFLYAANEEDLNTFYEFIHGQLNNQYVLTYTAKNQTRNERTLEISLDEELGGKTKTYYLVDPIYTDEGSDAYDPYTVEDAELTVYGLTAKSMYKSSKDQVLTLKGSGFDAGDDVTVRLVGSVKYDLAATYVDGETITVTVPAAIATDVYDLEVSIAEYAVSLKDELTVAVAGSTKNFTYGAYSFTAQKSYVDDQGRTVLSGNVTMNGWLRFKGDVTVSYDYYDSGKAWLADESGAYVSYSPNMAKGLAKFMADKGIPVSFGALGSFYICDDDYTAGSYKDFDVDRNDYYGFLNLHSFTCENFNLSVYPDMLRMQGMNFTFKLPMQEQMMRGWKQCPDKALVFDSDCLIGSDDIGLQGKVEYEDLDDEFTMVSLPLRLSKLDVELDTLKNDYSVTAKVGFKAMGKTSGLEFTLGVVDGGFDSYGLRQDIIDLPVVKTPVPVTISNFGFKRSGLNQYRYDPDATTKVLDDDISFIFDVEVADLAEYAPDIAKLLDDDGDVPLAELSDCTINVKLRRFRVSFDAKVMLANVLEVGEVNVTMGNFSYTNELIGFYDVDQTGLRIASKVDVLDWESPNLKLELNGSRELCLGYPYSGLWFQGDADFEIGWWLLSVDVDVSGDAMVGAFVNSSGNFQFSVILRGENSKGEYSGFHAYVTSVDGFDVHKY